MSEGKDELGDDEEDANSYRGNFSTEYEVGTF